MKNFFPSILKTSPKLRRTLTFLLILFNGLYVGFVDAQCSGNALSFNSNYVSASSITSVSNNFTMEFWVKPNNTIPGGMTASNGGYTGIGGQNYAVYPYHGGTSTNAGAGVSVGTNGVAVFEHTDNYIPALLVYYGTISSTSWTHIAVVYNSKTPSLYINGSQITPNSSTTSTITNVHPSQFLGDATNYYGPFYGSIDEFRIWDTPLSSSTISSWYNKMATSSHPNYSNLFTYWKLDEGTGTSASDASGNGHTGTLVSSPSWITSSVSLGSSPTLTIGSNSPVNVGSTLNLSCSGATSYSWTGPNGFSSTDQNPSISNIQTAGAGKYYVNGTKDGCSTLDSITVVINPKATGLAFDGSNDYVVIPDNAALDFGVHDFSVEFWVKKRASTSNWQNSYGLGKWLTGGSPGNNEWAVSLANDANNNIPSFSVESGTTIKTCTGSNAIPINTWTHIAGVREGAFTKIYVNGVLQSSLNIGSGFTVNNVGRTLDIGLVAGFAYTNAIYDEIRIWRRALCQSEIQANMNCELGNSRPNLVAYYKANQGFVNANNTGITTLIDSSGNGNNGTLINFALTGSASNWSVGNASGTCAAYQNISPSVSPASPLSSCSGGSFTLDAGSGYSSYLWSTSETTQTISVSTSGTYTVMVNGCSGSTDTVVVNINSQSLSATGNGFLTIDSLKATIANNNAKVIQWKNGASVVENTYASYNTSGTSAAGNNGQGSGATQLYKPAALCFDIFGNLYVADFFNNRIQKYPPGSTSASSGVTVAQNGINGAGGVFVDNDGNIYVGSFFNHQVLKYPPNSNSSTAGTVIAGGNGGGSGATQLNNPLGVYVDASGNLFVTDYSNNRVQKFPPNSTSSTNGVTFAGGNGGGSGANQLNGPIMTFVDATNNFYIADYANNRVQKFPSNSTSATNGVTVAANGLSGPEGVYVDALGTIYVASYNTHKILRYPIGSNSSTAATLIAGTGSSGNSSSQLNGPCGVGFDSQGNLYVPDYFNHRVQKFWLNTIDTAFFPTASGSYTATVEYSGGAICSTNAVTVNPPAKALNFTFGDHVTLTNTNAYDIGSTGSMTFECWIKRDYSGSDGIFSRIATSPAYLGYAMYIGSNNRLGMLVYTAGQGNASWSGGATINPGTWYHVAWVIDRSTNSFKTYVNGALDMFNSFPTINFTSSTADTKIGVVDAINYGLQGTMDEARYWNRALCQAEIQNNMNCALKPAGQTGLVSLFHLDQGFVNSNNSGITTAFDSSGNANNGTLNTFALTGSTSNWAAGTVNTTCSTYLAPEINVKGNGVNIPDGNNLYSSSDNTDFGITLPGVPIVKTFTIENTGNSNLTISAISNAANFTFGGISLPATISANSSTTFTVTFNATAVNTYPATINITNNDCNEANYNFVVKAQITCSTPAFTACPVNISVNTTSGTCNSIVNYTATASGTPTPTYSYNYSGATTGNGSGTGSGSTFNKGITNARLIATNACGNDTCDFIITVNDVQNPTAICQNITIQLDNTGNTSTSASAVNNNSSDACGISTLVLSQTTFVCAEVGNNAEVLTVTDVNGNSSTCSTTITVKDQVAPVAVCQNVTVQLDNSGNGSTAANAVNNNSSDACGIATLALSQTSFVCAEVGDNSEVLTVTDVNGNSSTCSTTITVKDQVAPVAVCQNVTVQLDNSGNGSTTANAVNNNSSDACGIASLGLSQTGFVCSEVGNNSEVLTVTDVNGNSSTCSTTITVNDQVAPVAVCQSVTVQLDNSGNGSTSANAVNNNSSDACGIATLALSQTTFGCAEVGDNAEVLTVTDVNGNSSTCSTTITVKDLVAPVAVCQNVTVQLDNSGNGSIAAAAVNSGSSDACGIATLALSQTTFGCAEVGDNAEVLTVTDVNGNSSTCSTTITVKDQVAPVAICQNVTVLLDNSGNGSTNSAAVNNNSSDACGIATLALSQTTFVCAEVGDNAEVLTVTDVNVNSSTCSTTITVKDQVAPVAVCQNVTVQLDNSGNGSTSANAVNNNSSDACGIANLALSQTTFVCAEVGNNAEVLTVTDVNGNSSTCSATITVKDQVAPVAVCQSVTVQLDNSGNGSTAATSVNSGSSDACGIASLVLSQTTFVCAEVGDNAEVLTVTDVNGNSSTCSATITVKDQVLPVANCQNVTVQLDISGNASTSAGAVNNNSSDACGIATLALSQTSFVCAEVGDNSEVLTVTDVNGNSSTCSTTITVKDQVAPVAVCQNVTVQLDNSGSGSTSAASVNNNSSDACGIATLALSQTTFVCAEVGDNSEVLTVTDVNGNSSTCSTTISVKDQVAPVAVCQNVTVQLDNSGNGSTSASAVNNNSSDACGIATLALSQTTFVCAEVGDNSEVLTVTDVNGNSSTCSATITVKDQVAPLAVCQNVTVQLDNSGNASTSAAAVSSGSSDACGIASLVLSQTTFVCDKVGDNAEVLTVTDVNGNSSTCATTVTVKDQIAPIAVCQNVTVTLSGGSASLTASQINNGSDDACGIHSLNLNNTSFTCSNIGANAITLTVADNNDNFSTCSASVTVIGTIPTINITQSNMPVFCQGGLISLTANPTGGLYFTYNWSTSQTSQSIDVDTSGSYRVFVTNNYGCTADDTFLLTYSDHLLMSSYTIIARDEVELKEKSQVQTGGVGVLGSDGEIELEQNSKITGSTTFAKAKKIKVNGGSTITTQYKSPLTVTLPDFRYNPKCNFDCKGKNDITVGSYKTVTLSDTIFGKIAIGKNSTVTFTGKVLFIKELKTSEGVVIKFTEECVVMLICDEVELKDDNTFNQTEKSVVVFVEDDFKVKKNSVINASVYSLDEIKVEANANNITYMKGLFIAEKVKSNYAIWNWNTACSECQNHLHKTKPQPVAEDIDGLIDPDKIHVNVYPNPNRGQFGVDIITSEEGSLNVSVYDMLGRLVFTSGELVLSGPTYIPINLEHAPKAQYFVRTTINGKPIIKPVIVNPQSGF